MRILIVTASYYPHYGGLETVVKEISTRFQQAGHTVALIANRYPMRLPKREEMDGLPVTRLAFIIPRLDYLKALRFDLWLAGLIFLPATLIELCAIIRRFRPDVVNLHYLGSPGLFVWMAHKLLRFKLIVSLHGGDVDGEPHRSRFARWLFQATLDRATGVTACSQALLAQALILHPSIESKARVIHNGVDAGMFLSATPYAHQRPYVVGVGKLERHKGFDVLIDAFAEIANRVPEVDLLIAGSGSEHEELEAQILRLNLQARAWLLGQMSRESVAGLMRGSLAVVIPSRREPFGIIGLEALASGKPIISTTAGGLPEALAGGMVTLAPPDDTPALRDTLLREVQRPLIELEQVALTNQRVAQERTWDVTMKAYLAAFSD